MKKEVNVFQKIYDFYQLFYLQLDHFPKKSRFVLGQEIETTILDLLESVAKAEYSSQKKTIELLNQGSANLDFLKILIRLCYELKIINQKKYIELEERLQEIGKMLGGWLRSLKA